jgi:hypothetical protein
VASYWLEFDTALLTVRIRLGIFKYTSVSYKKIGIGEDGDLREGWKLNIQRLYIHNEMYSLALKICNGLKIVSERR